MSEATPFGVLRRVTAVETAGSEIRVHTAQATLENAIKEGEIRFQQRLTAADLMGTSGSSAGVQYQLASTAAADGAFSIFLDSVVLFDQDGDESTKNDQITADGTISFTPVLDLDLDFHNRKISRLRFAAKVQTTSQLTFSAVVANASVPGERLLARYHFRPITVMVGPLPVVLVPVVEIHLGINGQVTAGVRGGFSYDVSAEASAEYMNGGWTSTKSSSQSARAEPVRAFATAKAEGYLSLPISLNLYGGPGPYADPRVFLELSADPLATPWWTLDWGLRVRFGVRASLFGQTLSDYEVPALIEYRARLAQAAGAFDGSVEVEVTPPATSIRVGETQLFRAIVTAGTDTVSGLPIRWSSSDTSVVSIDSSGLAKGVLAGSAMVSATVTGGVGQASVAVSPAQGRDIVVRWRFSGLGEILDYAVGPTGTVYAVVGAPGATSRLYALDRQTGAVLWRSATWAVPRAGPVVGDDGTVYVTGSDGFGRHQFVAAFDGQSGAVKWHSSGGGAVGYFHMPLIGGNAQLFVPSTSGGGGTGDGSVWAFNASTGAPDWYSEAPGWPQWAYLGAVGRSGLIYAASDSSLYALRTSGGSTAWRFLLGPRTTYQNVATAPAIGADGTVYVSEYGSPRPLVAIDGTTGALRWRVNDCRMSSLILDGSGRLLCAGDGLIAVDSRNGGRLWSFREGLGQIASHAAASDNTVIVVAGSHPYSVYVVDGSTGALRSQWTNEPSGEPRGSLVLASGGRVYIGYRFQLVALDTPVPGLAASSWPMLQHDPGKTSRAR